ncbi:MAG TPA: hypothetical protein VGI48_09555 [Caldimonas sp.]|jgi:hypothetical protein
MNTHFITRIVAALVSLMATYAIVASLSLYGLPQQQVPPQQQVALAASAVAP